jgi:hypothetical protein
MDPSLSFIEPATKSKIQSQTLAHFKTARTAFSSSIIHNEGNSLYKPGGTLTATTGKWTMRSIGQPITDDSGMGRWSGHSFLGKNGRQLCILTAYCNRKNLIDLINFYGHACLLRQARTRSLTIRLDPDDITPYCTTAYRFLSISFQFERAGGLYKFGRGQTFFLWHQKTGGSCHPRGLGWQVLR